MTSDKIMKNNEIQLFSDKFDVIDMVRHCQSKMNRSVRKIAGSSTFLNEYADCLNLPLHRSSSSTFFIEIIGSQIPPLQRSRSSTLPIKNYDQLDPPLLERSKNSTYQTECDIPLQRSRSSTLQNECNDLSSSKSRSSTLTSSDFPKSKDNISSCSSNTEHNREPITVIDSPEAEFENQHYQYALQYGLFDGVLKAMKKERKNNFKHKNNEENYSRKFGKDGKSRDKKSKRRSNSKLRNQMRSQLSPSRSQLSPSGANLFDLETTIDQVSIED